MLPLAGMLFNVVSGLIVDKAQTLAKDHVDKMLDDLVTFLLIRGTASVLATTMFYSSPAYGAWRTLNRTARMAGLRNPMSQRAIFGLESPLISRSLHAIMLALLTAKVITADDDEVYEDVVRDYAPAFWFTIFLWMMDFEKNFGRGLKTRIITNALQGMLFTMCWTILKDKFM